MSPLSDNIADEDYLYQITVVTGIRSKADTKSNIQFILSGENEDTGVRKLSDGVTMVMFWPMVTTHLNIDLATHKGKFCPLFDVNT